MSAALYNLAAMTVASTGAGPITLGQAATINGVAFLSFAAAGVPDGQPIYYSINDIGQSEVGYAAVSGGMLARNPITSTNSNAAINMTQSAIVRIMPVASQFREILTAPRTYYVRGDGSDSNVGLSNAAGGAFLTIQKAVNTIAGLDINGNNVTIQIADGAGYAGPVVLKNVVGFASAGNLVIQGNNGAPANVVVSCTGADAFLADGISSIWDIKDLKIQTATSGNCISAKNGATVRWSNINFGSCATAHLAASPKGNLICLSNYTVSGPASIHWFATDQSLISCAGFVVTITGTPNFTAWAYCYQLSDITCYSMTFSGAATGQRYQVATNSVIFTNGAAAAYLPGNAAGTGTNSGAAPFGLYA